MKFVHSIILLCGFFKNFSLLFICFYDMMKKTKIEGGLLLSESNTLKTKNDRILAHIYAGSWVLLSAVAIFEIPVLYMWAPTLLFLFFVIYRSVKRQPLDFPVFSGIALIVFSVTFVWSIYSPDYSLIYQAFPHFHAVFFLLMGYNFFRSEEPLQARFKKLENYILVIAILYMIYVSLNYGDYLLHQDIAPTRERHYWSLWYPGDEERLKASTAFSTSLLFAVVWGSFNLFFSEKWYKKVLSVVLIGYAVAFNISTGTRLLVYLTPVILVAEFFVWIVFHKKKYAVGVGITVGVVLLIGVGIVYLIVNKQKLVERFGGSVFDRFLTMGFGSPLRWKYLKNVWENFSSSYTGGGVNSHNVGTPHNMWFYLYDHGGIQSFILFDIFTVITAVNFIRFLKNKYVPTNVKFFIATLFGTVFVEFMLEDLINPLPFYYGLSMFTIGLFGGLAGYRPKESAPQAAGYPPSAGETATEQVPVNMQ